MTLSACVGTRREEYAVGIVPVHVCPYCGQYAYRFRILGLLRVSFAGVFQRFRSENASTSAEGRRCPVCDCIITAGAKASRTWREPPLC